MFGLGKVPRAFSRGLAEGINPKKAWDAYRRSAMEAADESILAWPFRKAIELGLKGTKHSKSLDKVRGVVFDNVSSKALIADMSAGHHLQKIPVIGKPLFTLKEDVPWSEGMKKTITRASALAPLVKVRDLATPILVGVGLERGIRALKKKNREPGMQNKQLRVKVASVMLHLHERNKEHEKRAYALRLLFKQAELGLTQLPQTHSDLETKLASLVTEDLVVLEKALELAGGNIKIGELGRQDPKSDMGAAEKFQAVILGDEF